MSEDHLEGLANLRDAMDRTTQEIEATQEALGAAQGQDETGAITVRIDKHGQFTDVTILEAWAELYEPEELGTAVLAAFTAATMARMEQWATGVEDQSTEPEPVTRPLPPREEELAGRLESLIGDADIDTGTAMQGLLGYLDELDTAIDQALAAVDAQTEARVDGYDTRRQVQAVVEGNGALIELIIDPDFAEGSHAFNISRAVTEAITSARQSAATATPEAMAPVHDLNAIVARAQDPQNLAAMLKPHTFGN